MRLSQKGQLMSETENLKKLDKQAGATAGSEIQPPRLDDLSSPTTHEERLACVRQSYERFFEKVREHDALLRPVELH